MKVLAVTSMYPVDRDPGLGAFVATQIDSLRGLGVDVDVVFLDVKKNKWELLGGIQEVRRKIKSNDYDLAHAHFGYNGIPLALQSRIPFVVSFCGTDLVSPRIRPISRWVSRRASACIVKSVEMQRQLDVDSHIIPNGIDLGQFQPMSRYKARQRLGLDTKGRYALFVSDPSRPEKQFELADSALASVRENGRAIDPLVVFNKPHSDLPTYMNAADLLLLTSSREGSPNAVKEAMACNLPIVSTDVGDVRQVIGNTENCLLADAAPDQIAEAIEQVLKTPRRTNGREAIAPLSAEAVGQRIRNIYENILEDRS
ncbi:TPA: glycosyl transferase family 1 [Candidatus Latescibacteria bacterium]|nr:glycosyl transferase family 1 [Candidatus Latescibacterota bacterium]